MSKLWFDDIRPAPNGEWIWARTIKSAIEVLKSEEILECSLDHDLGLEDLPATKENSVLKGSSPDGTGFDLIRWMCSNDKIPEKVTIHSFNPVGAEKMVKYLKTFGCKAIYIPYNYQSC